MGDSGDKKDDKFINVQMSADQYSEAETETAKQLNIPLDKVKELKRIYIRPNWLWLVSDEKTKQGRYFIPYGWYYVSGTVTMGENYKLQPVAQQQGSDILEMGPSDGKITAAHLASVALFEAFAR